MDATPVDVDHVAFLEQENATMAERAMEADRRYLAAQERADRATRDVAALELQLEANATATRRALDQAQRQIDRGATHLRLAHRRYDELEAERDRAVSERDALLRGRQVVVAVPEQMDLKNAVPLLERLAELERARTLATRVAGIFAARRRRRTAGA